MNAIDELVDRYCFAWSDADPAGREALLREVFARDAKYIDPRTDVRRHADHPIMKLTPINSPLAPAAVGGYSQALQVEGAQRLLFISGQVPEDVAGEVPPDFNAQAKLAWANVLAQLQAAGMSMQNLVKVTTFLSSREYAAANREERTLALGGHTPALTVIITDIFNPDWLLEIEAMAAA